MTKIDSYDSSSEQQEILASLKRDGAVIVERVLTPETCQAIAAELRPQFDRDGKGSMNNFNGFGTLRIASIPARSQASLPLFTHPLVMAAADDCLLSNCLNYQIGSTTAIEIWPGESAQLLHRDASCYHMEIPGMELQISVLWSLTEFTAENGPTRVVPGSHLWETGRNPTADDPVAEAVMPAGSALFYLGNTFHGGGANRSDGPRMALVNTYALGWLRQEENMYISVPREVADGLPEELRDLLGYRCHGMVGWYPGTTTFQNEDTAPPPVAIAAPQSR
ncbi:MAG: phytanoyl-CoA dioxygenase family protein [Rhodospirillales bacterium]